MIRLALLLTVLLGGMSAAQERITVQRSDGARVPVLEFLPPEGKCPPVLIISHGFGGTENGHAALAREASQQGMRALTIGHRESGRAELRAALRAKDRRVAMTEAVTDKAANLARMRDLDAVWDYANARCRPPFTALAGHSMGAGLTMIEAGAKNRVGLKGKRRFDAYVAMSPQGLGTRFGKGAWAGINKPMLMITGTRDRGLDGPWQHRLAAFEGLPEGHKYLAILQGGTHMDVGGLGRGRHQRNVRAIVLAFLRHMGKPSLSELPKRAVVTYRVK